MARRLQYRKENPAVFEIMVALESSTAKLGLERNLYELIKLRASQINGCAFCTNMHWQELRRSGETEARLSMLTCYKESGRFTERECAALDLTEAVTLISNGGVSDALYERVLEHFSPTEYVALVMAINTINAWNRIAISTLLEPTSVSD